MVHENASSFTAVRLARGLPWPLSHIVPHHTRLAYWWRHRDLARRTVDDVSAAVCCPPPLPPHTPCQLCEIGPVVHLQVFVALKLMEVTHCSPLLAFQVVHQFDETCKALKTFLGEREQFFSKWASSYSTRWIMIINANVTFPSPIPYLSLLPC